MPSIREKAIRLLGGVTIGEHTERLREEYQLGFDDGNDDPATGTIRKGGMGYRSMTQRNGSFIAWEENLRVADDLRQSNALAMRSASIKRDYIVGPGLAIKAGNPRLQEILDRFWRLNRMDAFLSEIVFQWIVYGAQVIPAFVRPSDGFVSLGYIAPHSIERVIPHPDNARRMMAVVLKMSTAIDPWQQSEDRQVLRVVQFQGERWVTASQDQLEPWEHEMLRTYDLVNYTGDCFLMRKNALSDQPLGRSDFLAVADYCDQYDETMFALGEREVLANLVMINVAVDGDEKDVRRRAQDIEKNPPRPGSINVHTNAEEWNMNSPTLNQTASVATADAQRKHILGGLGVPDAWFGAPAGSHLATVTAQGDPTWRTFAHDQGLVRMHLIEMLEFVRDQAIAAGYYIALPDDDNGINVIMPEMAVRDVVGLASAVSTMVSAMSIAVQDGFVDKESAIDAVAKVLSELDVDVDKEAVAEEHTNAVLGDWFLQHPAITAGADGEKDA